MRRPKALFISWANSAKRSDRIAHQLAIPSYKMTFLPDEERLPQVLRLLPLAVKTLSTVLKNKPDVIIAQNRSLVGTATCLLAAKLTGARLVLDSENDVHAAGRAVPFIDLSKFFAKQADLNIVMHEQGAKTLERWDARSIVLSMPAPLQTTVGEFPLRNGFNVAVINSFAAHEPINVVFEAARALPQMNFYLTGDLHLCTSEMLQSRPANVIFTDFLGGKEYLALLKNADVALCLSRKDQAAIEGAVEALTMGTPTITSESLLANEIFHGGTRLVQNCGQDVVAAIEDVKEHNQKYRAQIPELHNKWRNCVEELGKRLSQQ